MQMNTLHLFLESYGRDVKRIECRALLSGGVWVKGTINVNDNGSILMKPSSDQTQQGVIMMSLEDVIALQQV